MMDVMTVFSVDSLTPRSAKKAVIRGRIVSSNTCREVAVTMKSSAQLTSLMWGTRRGHCTPVHDGFKSVQHQVTDHRRDAPPLGATGRGGVKGPVVDKTTPEPL